jgi:hypothetical protein
MREPTFNEIHGKRKKKFRISLHWMLNNVPLIILASLIDSGFLAK